MSDKTKKLPPNSDPTSDDAADAEDRPRTEEEINAKLERNNKAFLSSDFTFETWYKKVQWYRTAEEAEKELSLCVAQVTNPTMFVFKMANQWTGFTYELLLPDEARKKMALANRRDWGRSGWTAWGAMTDASGFRRHMAMFERTELMSSNPLALSFFRPVRIKDEEYCPARVKEFLDFIETRVLDPRAWQEELASHAYRFRHPDARMVKVFIHFSVTGGTGKTFLMHLFGGLYQGKLAFVGANEQTAQDKYNAWQADTLLAGFEELENSNYKNKWFETYLKQATSGKGPIRDMYKAPQNARFRFMLMLNSNQPDLYGMVRGKEPALWSRFVILPFKEEKLDDAVWDAVRKKAGIEDNDIDNYSEGKRIFLGSLYRYLKDEYQLPEGFVPERYYSPARDEFIRHAQEAVDEDMVRFFSELGLKDEDDPYGLCRTSPYDILKMHIPRKGPYDGQHFYYCHTDDFDKAVSSFQRDTPDARKFNVKTVREKLLNLVWEGEPLWVHRKAPDKHHWALYVESSKWKKWCDSKRPLSLEDEGTESETEESETE